MKTRLNKAALHKRGELTSFATIIIFAIVFLCMIFIVKIYMSATGDDADMRQCQASLLLTKATSSLSPSCLVGTATPFTLECPRGFVDISKDEKTSKMIVERNGKTVTKNYDPVCPDGTNTCLEKNVAAAEMARCWKTFFNGEEIVLQNIDIASKKAYLPKDYVHGCFVCSEIEFSSENGDLLTYLHEKQMPKSELTYYDYLANNTKAWCDPDYNELSGTCWDGVRTRAKKAGWTNKIIWVSPILGSITNLVDSNVNDLHPELNYTINSSKKYAVVFVRRGLGTCDNEKQNEKWMTHQHLTNTVQLVPVDQLNAMCDRAIA